MDRYQNDFYYEMDKTQGERNKPLLDKIARLEAEKKALLEALHALYDVQNGPPLIAWAEEYEEAMGKAALCLIKARKKDDK